MGNDECRRVTCERLCLCGDVQQVGKGGCTARYLGTIVKDINGETAKTWIDRALVSKAKVMLRHTDKQVSEVADALGFPTSSFFCRFFREHAGYTPQEYRNG